MNEKIKEFAKNYFVFESRDNFGNWEDDPHYEFSEEELENFAKLIVRECVHVCLNVDSEYFCEYINGKLCAEEIKQHLGVSP